MSIWIALSFLVQAQGEPVTKWTSEIETRAKKLIEQHFKTESEEERKEIETELSTFPPLTRDRVRTFKALIWGKVFPKQQPRRAAAPKGRSDGRQVSNPLVLPMVERRTFSFKGEEAEYFLRIPQGGGKGLRPLLIGLHGSGVDGTGAAQHWLWEVPESAEAFGIFPTVLPSQKQGWNEANEEYVLALILAVRKEFPIDPNRVYLFGHSMGGGGTWTIAGHHADLFAAISPNAGFWFEENLLRNLLNTPAYFWHGADDTLVSPEGSRKAAKLLKEWGYKHVYKEFNGIGHGNPPNGVHDVVKWVFEQRRNPIPSRLVWYGTSDGRDHHYWLTGRMGTSGSVQGKLERNTIRLETSGDIEALSVLLNEAMISLQEPVTLWLNDQKVYEGIVPLSLGPLFESIVHRQDPTMIFTASRVVLTR